MYLLINSEPYPGEPREEIETFISRRDKCYELLLDGLIPCPADSMTLDDIIDFRRYCRDELIAFRVAVNEMLEGVMHSEAPLDAIQNSRDSIEHSIRSIQRAARGRKMWLLTTAVSVLLGAPATAYFGGADAIHWVFDGVGVAVGASLATRAVRGPAEIQGMSYLVRAYHLAGGGTQSD
jgi:hypothetical protein